MTNAVLLGVAGLLFGVVALVLVVVLLRPGLLSVLKDPRLKSFHFSRRGLVIERTPAESGTWDSFEFPPEIEVRVVDGSRQVLNTPDRRSDGEGPEINEGPGNDGGSCDAAPDRDAGTPAEL